MKKSIYIVSIAWFLGHTHFLKAEPIISFFMRYAPDEKNIKKTIQNRHITYNYEPYAGIYAVYGGMLQISDLHGEIYFPRRHEKVFIYIIVTTNIIPVRMFHNTIHHLEIDPKTPTTIYRLERKQGKKADEIFWDVEIGSLPENNVIPLESITIFAKPENLYIPVGATQTTASVNLLLPDVYIKKGLNVISNALYILTIKNIFKDVTTTYEKKADRYTFKVS